ncbi:MAG TPA: MBL fold metallo-hydrolase [Magnetospirillaceae bacterium]|nr:MBL fold metallo-hydrolase [Magnetospirillaceae bacterium]
MARISFIGAAGVVTGSKHLVETDSGARVLLDCGMFQGLPELTQRNWTPPPVDPKTLDAVLLSHAHLDHCGYLPALTQQGFTGPVYTTPATIEVATLVLRDSAGLQEDEAQRAKRHPERGLHTTPLYTDDDVTAVTKLFKSVNYNDDRTDIAGCRFQLVDAGHILGSAIIQLWFQEGKLTFSGDLGRYGRPLLNDPTAVAESTVVLCESTYGDRLHPTNDPQVDLGAVINAACKRNGVLVIPAFAIGRTQEILYAIGGLQRAGTIPQIDVYVDSPMGNQASEIMARHPEAMRINLKQQFGAQADCMGAQRVTMVQSVDDSKRLNDLTSKAVIISSSGMATGGRVLHHLRNRLPRPNDTVCFVGFEGPGTPGNMLLNGAKTIKIMGVPIPVHAAITHIDGFSAHADKNELLRWFGGFTDKPQVYLVHADPAAAASLATAVAAKYGFPTQVAKVGEVVTI